MRRKRGEPSFMNILPESIYEFRAILHSDTVHLPELRKNRKCTDVLGLIIFVLFLATVIGCFIAMPIRKNIKMLFNGVDSCGNICGVRNDDEGYIKTGCKLQDYSDYPVLLYTPNNSKCIKKEECKPRHFQLLLHRCFLKNRTTYLEDVYETLDDIVKAKFTVMATFLLATGLSFLLYFCFRLSPYFTCLSINTGTLIYSIITGIMFWFMTVKIKGCRLFEKFHKIQDLFPSIPAGQHPLHSTTINRYWYLVTTFEIYLLMGTLTIIYLTSIMILLLFIHERLRLVTRLYEEATKAIFKSPILLFQPLITIIVIVMVSGIAVYFYLLFYFTEDGDNFKRIRPIYMTLLVISAFWLATLATGCQCMIVAKVIASNYFIREEEFPRCSYWGSVWIIIRYHLGSVAVNSFASVILKIIKPFADRVQKKHENYCLSRFEACCQKLREYVEYVTRKGIIMTAIHGKSFYTSGKRACRLRWLYLADLIIIDTLAHVNTHIISFFLVIFSSTLGLLVLMIMKTKHYILCLILVICLSGIASFSYASLINVTIQTLVLCFCEDRFMNRGTRYDPYYMNVEFFTLMIEALDLSYKEIPHENYDHTDLM